MLWKRLAADFVLLFHFAFAFFGVFGAFFVIPHVKLVLMHLAVVAWSSIINLAGRTCPLTPLEQNLRQESGGKSYTGGWLYHYLNPLVRPLGMPRRLELIAGFSILAWNLLVYLVLYLVLYLGLW